MMDRSTLFAVRVCSDLTSMNMTNVRSFCEPCAYITQYFWGTSHTLYTNRNVGMINKNQSKKVFNPFLTMTLSVFSVEVLCVKSILTIYINLIGSNNVRSMIDKTKKMVCPKVYHKMSLFRLCQAGIIGRVGTNLVNSFNDNFL